MWINSFGYVPDYAPDIAGLVTGSARLFIAFILGCSGLNLASSFYWVSLNLTGLCWVSSVLYSLTLNFAAFNAREMLLALTMMKSAL